MIGKAAVAWVMLAVVLFTAGCATSKGPAPVGDRTQGPGWNPAYHVVQPGDTLYAIAWAHGLDYKQLAAWNRVRAPYTIYPGQRLRLTATATSASQRSAGSSSTSSKNTPHSSSTKPTVTSPKPKPSTTITHTPPGGGSSVGWQWPTDGKVIRGFSANDPGKKGLDIGGKPGQSVRATAPGQVVYSGGGLIGYGQLIIIKHDKDYLSAYAHNRKLLVKEDDRVRGGQQIAELGSTGTDRPMLHFEIRHQGKPVDPLKLLPKR